MAMNQRYVFAVWGAPGGGKTTLAANLATVLADSGYMTCLVSASDHGELQAFFNQNIPKDKGLYAAISSGRHVREALVEASPNLCLLELDTGGDAYDIASITPDQVKSIISDLRDQFSYVIVDCTNYKESVFTGVGLVEADKIILCIPHRTTAATWHFANAQMIDALSSKIFFVDIDTRAGGTNMNQLFASIGLQDCDLSVPRVDRAYECENFGSPIVRSHGRQESKYRACLLKLVQILLDIENEEKRAAAANKKKKEKKDKRGKKPGRDDRRGPSRNSRDDYNDPRRRRRDYDDDDYDDDDYDDDDYDDDDDDYDREEEERYRRPRSSLPDTGVHAKGRKSARRQDRDDERAMRNASRRRDYDDDYDD